MREIAATDYFTFDTVEYIKKLRHAGASQEVAETQAQELEHVVHGVLKQAKAESKELFNSKELATKGDVALLKSDIKVVKGEIEVVKGEIEIVRGEIRESELRLQKEIEMVRKEIAESSTKMVVWVAGLLGTVSVFFFGILAKGFGWW